LTKLCTGKTAGSAGWIIYEIADERLIILVVGVGHRREAYRALS